VCMCVEVVFAGRDDGARCWVQAPSGSVARIVLGGGRRLLDRVAAQAARGIELVLGRPVALVLNVRHTKK
jgi:hypothetical protein